MFFVISILNGCTPIIEKNFGRLMYIFLRYNNKIEIMLVKTILSLAFLYMGTPIIEKFVGFYLIIS
jgi:hypothetical protein